jgi:hypothetical protein
MSNTYYENTPLPRTEFLERAEQFWRAYKALPGDPHELFDWPKYLLLLQTVENALKAYLSANLLTMSELKTKPFGHDLDALLAEATDRGIKLSDAAIRNIKQMSPLHLSFLPRYPNFDFSMKDGITAHFEWADTVEELLAQARSDVYPPLIGAKAP